MTIKCFTPKKLNAIRDNETVVRSLLARNKLEGANCFC